MSGVIDSQGIQWERCNGCAKFIKMENLGYEEPSSHYKYGRSLCISCTNTAPDINKVRPAKSWLPVFDETNQS